MKVPSHRVDSGRLKAAMLAKGIRKAKLAGAIGVWPSQIKRWLDGHSTPAGDNLTKLCKALDVTPAYLFGESETGDERAKVIADVLRVFGRTEADALKRLQRLTDHHKTIAVGRLEGWIDALVDYEQGRIPVTPYEREQAEATRDAAETEAAPLAASPTQEPR